MSVYSEGQALDPYLQWCYIKRVMSVLTRPIPPLTETERLLGTAPSSPAGPVESLAGLREPPAVKLPKVVQTLWFGQKQTSFVFHHPQRFGDVWSAAGYVR